MFKRLWLRLTTPSAVRLAQNKRRLEHIAKSQGCSRTQAARIASEFFGNQLADTVKKCHNGAVTVERDVRSTPSSKACAGCASEKSAPCEQHGLTDSRG